MDIYQRLDKVDAWAPIRIPWGPCESVESHSDQFLSTPLQKSYLPCPLPIFKSLVVG